MTGNRIVTKRVFGWAAFAVLAPVTLLALAGCPAKEADGGAASATSTAAKPSGPGTPGMKGAPAAQAMEAKPAGATSDLTAGVGGKLNK